MSENLKSRITELYRLELNAREMAKSYSAAASRSGGDEEARYKSLRNEALDQAGRFQAEYMNLQQELLSKGFHSMFRDGGQVIFERA